ncbi:hypothetical protein LEM8419_03518 [Neolewinella maritima]|uniref:Putative exodeoxyribonuclease 8 PDDEXK-like domain-containing protein n=1 Tax=Neolewinella maritima TaxID=1383882 RepID=A0ABN8FBX4_9BACT|nr:PD-(D/E)XK nuclease-like domain-containing protein [Neolewinella maritima]CAH1002646.1 hypothetical protein LEM8419_03518 [Neolewinella maritima]
MVRTTYEHADELIAAIERREITLSYSSIKKFMESPRHFVDYKLEKHEPTPAMQEGKLVDYLLTEPERVPLEFAVLPPDCSLGSKVGVEAYAEFLGIDVPAWKDRSEVVNAALEMDTRTFMTTEAMDRCKVIAEAVHTNPASRWIVEAEGINQHRLSFEAFGWTWRGARDKYVPEMFIADYKKTSDATPRRFHRQMLALRYPLQAALYTIGPGENLPYFLVAYDNDAHVSVTELTEVTMRQAWDGLERTMDAFERCIALGEWNKSYDFWPSEDFGIYTY